MTSFVYGYGGSIRVRLSGAQSVGDLLLRFWCRGNLAWITACGTLASFFFLLEQKTAIRTSLLLSPLRFWKSGASDCEVQEKRKIKE